MFWLKDIGNAFIVNLNLNHAKLKAKKFAEIVVCLGNRFGLKIVKMKMNMKLKGDKMNSLLILKVNKLNGYGVYEEARSEIYVNNKYVCDYYSNVDELIDVLQKVLGAFGVDCEIKIEEEYL